MKQFLSQMNRGLRPYFFWAAVAALLFIPFLGGVHLFDWDEINFAEISREMIERGNYLQVTIDFQPFFQKPPLFFWLQALSMQLFGVTEFAARFPNAVCGMLTLMVLYRLGRQLYDHRFGMTWTVVYLGSVLPFLYFKSGIIDPYFNLFIFLGLYHVILFYWKKDKFEITLRGRRWGYLLAGGLFLGLGILTKGPVALLLPGLTMVVYWIYQRLRFYISIPEALLLALAAILLPGLWFGLETLLNGPAFFRAFIAYNIELAATESAGHGGFPGYHFVVLLVGCFPASIFALRAFRKYPPAGKDYQNDFRLWMLFLFWVVLIVFTLVESKIVHYSSLCYFPLTFLAANVLYRIQLGRQSFTRWMRIGLWAVISLYSLILLLIPMIGVNPGRIQNWIDDPFAVENLNANVYWSGMEFLPALLWIGILIWALRFFRKKKPWRATYTLFGGTSLVVLLILVFFVKRIEGYTQRANIEFFSSLEGEDAYIYTYGYKSYAHLYYPAKPYDPDCALYDQPEDQRQEWLMNAPEVDKPVYFSVRIQRAEELRAHPNFTEIGGRNGFVFFKRSPGAENRTK